MSAIPALARTTRLRPGLPGDIEGIHDLINRYAARELMLPKSREELRATVGQYLVITDVEGAVVACGGLRVYRPDLAEVIGLAVDEAWQARGLGSEIVGHLVDRARLLGVERLFAMTLSESFFQRHGFQRTLRSSIPAKEEAADCLGCARRAGCREIAVELLMGNSPPRP